MATITTITTMTTIMMPIIATSPISTKIPICLPVTTVIMSQRFRSMMLVLDSIAGSVFLLPVPHQAYQQGYCGGPS